ncbi:MAG: hypothetical protein KTR15_05495 [Phycisphaeraceae bacterium]|nr:hypothetical protein [Phycisphaeraceae bacterium]
MSVYALLLLGLLTSCAHVQYDSQVSRWVAQDAADPLPAGGIVFAGSSSIRRWEGLALSFADYNIAQRGLGGATFSTYLPHVDDAIISLSPRAVVLWLGTNDIASGVSGDDVVIAFNEFTGIIHKKLPSTTVFYLGIMPTPGRQENRDQEDIANAGIASVAAGDERIHYIDLPAVFDDLGAYSGAGFMNKFVDSIHLNRDGYRLWRSVIRPEVAAAFPPDKVHAETPTSLKAGERLLFDFGPINPDDGDPTDRPDVNGNHWNYWVGNAGGVRVIAGEHQGGLVNTDGADTGMRITITGDFGSNGKLHGGLFAPDTNLLGDLAVESATVDFFFSTADDLRGKGDDDLSGGFMIDGLDPGLTYSFKFFGSRNTAETQITEYKVIGTKSQSARLETSRGGIGTTGAYNGNSNQVAQVFNIRPDINGQVFVDLNLVKGSYAYINAMEIVATSDTRPISPGVVGRSPSK